LGILRGATIAPGLDLTLCPHQSFGHPLKHYLIHQHIQFRATLITDNLESITRLSRYTISRNNRRRA
jgi:hypothetical protein